VHTLCCFSVANAGRLGQQLLKRIIGGEESEENQWPWLVKILRFDPKTNTYKHRCGGTLIDAEWVLTAAHCLAFKLDGKYIMRLGRY